MTDVTTTRLTGGDLRVARIRAGVRQVDLARAMGVTHPRINAIEGSWRPTPEAARRYLEALELLVGMARP